MININNVVLIGRLTKDIDLRKTQSNVSICQFTLVIDRPKRKDQDKSDADFINCVAWSYSADYLANYASKGSIISVEGRIQTRTYDGPNGKVFITEINANNVQIINQKKIDQPEIIQIEKTDTSKFGGYASESVSDLNVDTDNLPFY